ncbi:MAG: tripartite tricarboxylate transporter TctB family protein [Alphaproteobacteria bacterium]|nr:tripartite tricarboxylate transporter TctB family protein [Alphaproteobacteria bacterium]
MHFPKGAAARDSVSALVIMAVSAVGVYSTFEFPQRAAAWPLYMWGLLAALSMVLLINSLRQSVSEQLAHIDKAERNARVKRIAINVGLILGFVILVPILGFFTAAGIYLVMHMTYLGIRPFWLVGVVMGGVLIAFYMMFEFFLGVLVPHGLIF